MVAARRAVSLGNRAIYGAGRSDRRHGGRPGLGAEPECPVTTREDRGNRRRERQYRDRRILQDLEHKIVILTDDGPAMGATMRAAVMSLRQRKIARCSRPYLCLSHLRDRPDPIRAPQSAGWHPPVKIFEEICAYFTRIPADAREPQDDLIMALLGSARWATV